MNDERRAPDWLFYQLDGVFRFTLDAAATSDNTKCDQFYDQRTSGLVWPWTGHVFCNPPYSHGQLIQWVQKARKREARVSVLLLPADTSTKWFPWDANVLLFVRKRIAFDGLPSGARFPSVLAIFGHNTARIIEKVAPLKDLAQIIVPQ